MVAKETTMIQQTHMTDEELIKHTEHYIQF